MTANLIFSAEKTDYEHKCMEYRFSVDYSSLAKSTIFVHSETMSHQELITLNNEVQDKARIMNDFVNSIASESKND